MTLDLEHDALIIVDVQNDFCPGGPLGVPKGDEVVPVLNDLAGRFRHVVLTRDWHPPNHCSFAEDPRFVDMSWPVHCVAGSPGAAFHPDLKPPEGALIVDKAQDPETEAYSGFQGTDLTAWLEEREIHRVFVGGLATDYCVEATALDARDEGFEVVVVTDACRGIDNPPGSADEALEEMTRAGAVLAKAHEVGT